MPNTLTNFTYANFTYANEANLKKIQTVHNQNMFSNWPIEKKVY